MGLVSFVQSRRVESPFRRSRRAVAVPDNMPRLDPDVVRVLAAVEPEVAKISGVDAFGLLVPHAVNRSMLHVRSRLGSAGYLLGTEDLPSPFLERRTRPEQFDVTSSHLDRSRPFDELLAPESIRQLAIVPLPSATFWIGSTRSEPFTTEQMNSAAALGATIEHQVQIEEPADESIDRLRRLEALGELLTKLADAEDVRDVFNRMAAIVDRVLPHDALALSIPAEDPSRAQVYVRADRSEAAPPETVDVLPRSSAAELWRYFIVDDLQADRDPLTTSTTLTTSSRSTTPTTLTRLTRLTAAAANARASLRVPIRLRDGVLGELNILSHQPGRFTSRDLAVAARLADHIALALSHQQLAAQARQVGELRSRNANLELLDELMTTVTGSGTLAEVFDRISTIARKLVPHDALVLPVLLPDGKHGRVYAGSGMPSQIPEVVEVPQSILLNPEWEYQIVGDMRAHPEHGNAAIAGIGYRSTLRVPIRLEGKFAAALVFVSFAPDVYKESDVLIARRMADRITVSLARERAAEASQRADQATARAARLESRVQALTEELDARTGYRRVVGTSAAWHEVLTQATQVAATDTTVLLLGESGTGKEVVARFIARASARADGPFVAINCAALPEQLLEAELFGYERGAFTGATQSKPGQLEQAAGGTLFLDEVAEMNSTSQAKFLRVLQEREFQRLGGTRVLKTDVRIVAATNRDLQKAMARGQFRDDLYYRLNVFAIQLPPLRDRRDDILPLSQAFISEIGRSLGRPPAGMSREAQRALLAHHWPGHVRELRNVLERAAILCDGGLIAAEHLALRPQASAATADVPPASRALPPLVPSDSDGTLKPVERALIEKALREARFNKSKAAKRLGLSRAQLYVRMRRHGLD